MTETRHRRISEVLGERSFRNALGYVVFFLTVILPTLDSWESGDDVERADSSNQRPMAERIVGITPPGEPERLSGPNRWKTERGFGPVRGWPGNRPTVREQMNQSWWPDTSRWMWLFGKTCLALLGATVSLMILMPFRGCKRYALLFGPPMGFMVVSAVGLWLLGRTEIYRFEPVIIGVLAASPAFALWYLCCKSAYESRGQTSPVVPAEIIDERRFG